MVTGWSQLTVVGRRNDVGRWTLVTSSPQDAQLLSPPVDASGAVTAPRGVILRRDDGVGTPITFTSGWVEGLPQLEHRAGVTTWTFSGWDDTVVLADTTCWPRPASPIGSQTDAYNIVSGPASDRIRNFFVSNVQNRLGIPGVAAGLTPPGLGPSGTSQARFTGLLALAQDIAGRDLNFIVRQRDGDRMLFLFQWLPVDKRLVVQFSPALGSLSDWSYTITPAGATRVVVGAGGEGEARGFRLRTRSAEESALGNVRKIERFQDRRDLSLDEPDWQTDADASGDEFLTEAASTAAFAFTATDLPGMRAYVDFSPGDLVRAYIDQDADGQPVGLVDDLIEEMTTTWSAEGERCQVRIGDTEDLDPTTRLAKNLRAATRRIAELEARR
jgi:hypothetical protein